MKKESLVANGGISQIFPVIASLCWLGTLLGLLIHWNVIGQPHYPSMDPTQSIAYISDVGAQELKPLFIAGSAVTTVAVEIGFFADRWLRHRGRLARNLTLLEKVLSGLSMVFAIIGAAGLILLSIFDTWRHPRLHDVFLLLFIVGYVVSAIFICWEYQRLRRSKFFYTIFQYIIPLPKLMRRNLADFGYIKILRISYWIKIFFILVEVALAIGKPRLISSRSGVIGNANRTFQTAFVSTNWSKTYNAAAVLEWTVAFIFTFYLASFIVDLWPARHTHDHEFDSYAAKNAPRQMEMGAAGVGAGQHRPWRDTLESERTLTEPPATAGGRHAGAPRGTMVGNNGRVNGYQF